MAKTISSLFTPICPLFVDDIHSLVCFNQQLTKCVMVFSVQYGQDVSNGLNYFYGVKVSQKWLFFRGPHLYLPSEAYGYPPKSALPFSALHEQAMNNIFKAYLKKVANGQWQINEKFFADLTGNSWCINCNQYKTPAQWDSIYLNLTRQNWHYRSEKAH